MAFSAEQKKLIDYLNSLKNKERERCSSFKPVDDRDYILISCYVGTCPVCGIEHPVSNVPNFSKIELIEKSRHYSKYNVLSDAKMCRHKHNSKMCKGSKQVCSDVKYKTFLYEIEK